ncbi:MAG TPA: TrkA family potassium uptake protein [Thermomicrobiales bacterium]|nr:TrkA family potassium uptake protein [Thermomicrobiales bacterium]
MRNGRPASAERVAVIGLGRFGSSLAGTLNELGYEVTAIDLDARRIQEIANLVTLAAQGDGTDEALLRQLDVEHSDVAVVAQGENLEASVLTTLLLKKLEIPWVVAKAKTSLHGELLRKVGADRVIFPEVDAGKRLAHSLGVRHISDYISLSPAVGVAKLEVPAYLAGKSLANCKIHLESMIDVLLIQRGADLIVAPGDQEILQPHDEIVVVGADVDIESFVAPPGAPA